MLGTSVSLDPTLQAYDLRLEEKLEAKQMLDSDFYGF